MTAGSQPLVDALVYDKNNTERFTKTDKDGKYELNIPSGPQTVVVEAAGYVPQTLVRNIDVGTVHRQSFSLDAELMEMAA